jgi:mRNA interferase RelE/StbE
LASKNKWYAIFFKPGAEKALTKLPKKDQRLVAERINALAENPRPMGAEKLEGMKELYRVRSGNYRIIYAIEDEALKVLVVSIGDRKDVYRG